MLLTFYDNRGILSEVAEHGNNENNKNGEF